MQQLAMVRGGLDKVAEPVAPEGIILRSYQAGDELAWAQIVNATDMGRQYDASKVKDSLTGQVLFEPQGLFFAVDSRTGKALATACAWWTRSFGRARATLHMVAGLPEGKGRGLGRLVCQAVMHYFGRRGQREMVLTTDEHRLPALATYLNLGWRPMRYVRAEDHAARWEAVLANLGGGCGTLEFAGPGRPISIAVLGLRRGLDLASNIRAHPAARIVAGCDIDPAMRERFSQRLEPSGSISARRVSRPDASSPAPDAAAQESRRAEFSVTDRYEALLEQDAQAVIVAHDCPDHAPAAVAALRAGKDVFSEVTAFHTPAQGVELVETVEATGRAYMLGENCLYENPMMELTHQAFVGALGGLQYAEGDYVHDCRYLALRDGQRYWRSWYPPIFYCTHPLGPILRACRQRPVRVVGMHTGRKLEGTAGGIDMGAMLIQTDGGSAIRILSGFAVNREPASLWVCYYGTKASLETDRWDDKVHLFDPAQQHLHGPAAYRPTGRDGRPYTTAGHYGADGRTMEYWLESLANGLEMPVDAYEAGDMTLPGLLAWRSSLTGSAPLDVPDFRSPAARDAFRADHLRPDPEDPMKMIS